MQSDIFTLIWDSKKQANNKLVNNKKQGGLEHRMHIMFFTFQLQKKLCKSQKQKNRLWLQTVKRE